MLNVVILSEDLDYARYLMNLLNRKNNNLRILAIFYRNRGINRYCSKKFSRYNTN